MKSKDLNKKPNFKFVTPKVGSNTHCLKIQWKRKQISQMKMNKKIFGYEGFLHFAKHKNEDFSVNVYIATFARILGSSFYELKNIKTGKIELVHTYPFYLKYREAYVKGRNYFNETFGVSSEVVYGKNGQLFERTLHTHYYHTSFDNFGSGWNYWEKWYPEIFDLETFSTYGYNGGIISALNDFKKLHPLLFQNFSVCKRTDHNDVKEQVPNVELEDLKRTQIPNQFNSSMPITVPINHFKILFESTNEKKKPYIFQEDFNKFIHRAFLGSQSTGKIKMRIPSGGRGGVVKLFYEFYVIGKQYENNFQVRDKYIRLLTDYFEGWDFEHVKKNFKK